jgi:hypothetical protein
LLLTDVGNEILRWDRVDRASNSSVTNALPSVNINISAPLELSGEFPDSSVPPVPTLIESVVGFLTVSGVTVEYASTPQEHRADVCVKAK